MMVLSVYDSQNTHELNRNDSMTRRHSVAGKHIHD